MSFDLTTPKAVNKTVAKYNIQSFTIDIERSEINIYYQELDSLDGVIEDKFFTIVEPEFTAAITEASTIAGSNVYIAIKTALYNSMAESLGDAGTIV